MGRCTVNVKFINGGTIEEYKEWAKKVIENDDSNMDIPALYEYTKHSESNPNKTYETIGVYTPKQVEMMKVLQQAPEDIKPFKGVIEDLDSQKYYETKMKEMEETIKGIKESGNPKFEEKGRITREVDYFNDADPIGRRCTLYDGELTLGRALLCSVGFSENYISFITNRELEERNQSSQIEEKRAEQKTKKITFSSIENAIRNLERGEK